MNKAEVRRIIRNMGLPEAQARAARRTNAGAMDSEDLEFARAAAGTIVISRTRYGCDGKPVFEYTIEPDGSTQVVRRVYDSAGNFVCDDSEGTTP
jgi:hypothetical protein